ncbi:MAG: hypothetical protein J3Q66DRAFT_443995 [Benniella sp.]|nr:MAG: hypothetical protein J3Q66DRAFT_443995 [Benniella sp.]
MTRLSSSCRLLLCMIVLQYITVAPTSRTSTVHSIRPHRHQRYTSLRDIHPSRFQEPQESGPMPLPLAWGSLKKMPMGVPRNKHRSLFVKTLSLRHKPTMDWDARARGRAQREKHRDQLQVVQSKPTLGDPSDEQHTTLPGVEPVQTILDILCGTLASVKTHGVGENELYNNFSLPLTSIESVRYAKALAAWFKDLQYFTPTKTVDPSAFRFGPQFDAKSGQHRMAMANWHMHSFDIMQCPRHEEFMRSINPNTCSPDDWIAATAKKQHGRNAKLTLEQLSPDPWWRPEISLLHGYPDVEKNVNDKLHGWEIVGKPALFDTDGRISSVPQDTAVTVTAAAVDETNDPTKEVHDHRRYYFTNGENDPWEELTLEQTSARVSQAPELVAPPSAPSSAVPADEPSSQWMTKDDPPPPKTHAQPVRPPHGPRYRNQHVRRKYGRQRYRGGSGKGFKVRRRRLIQPQPSPSKDNRANTNTVPLHPQEHVYASQGRKAKDGPDRRMKVDSNDGHDDDLSVVRIILGASHFKLDVQRQEKQRVQRQRQSQVHPDREAHKQ